MKAAPYKFDAPEQKALTTYIKHQALGKPMHVDLSEGEMQSWWEKGKEIYYTRFGQLNLACASCHEENNGRYIRADHLSQGRSEEHTSELQSLMRISYAVFCLKKKKNKNIKN